MFFVRMRSIGRWAFVVFSRFGFNRLPSLPGNRLFKDVFLRRDGNGACLGLPKAPGLHRVSFSYVLCQHAFDWSMVLCLYIVFGSSSIDPQVFLEMVRLRWCTHLLNRHTKQHERDLFCSSSPHAYSQRCGRCRLCDRTFQGLLRAPHVGEFRCLLLFD